MKIAWKPGPARSPVYRDGVHSTAEAGGHTFVITKAEYFNPYTSAATSLRYQLTVDGKPRGQQERTAAALREQASAMLAWDGVVEALEAG